MLIGPVEVSPTEKSAGRPKVGRSRWSDSRSVTAGSRSVNHPARVMMSRAGFRTLERQERKEGST
jgi:hypothetical protein